MWGYMNHGWWGWGHGIVMVLFWIVLVFVVLALMRSLPRRSGDGSARSPMDILKERYARGEIDKDEFEQKKRDLQG